MASGRLRSDEVNYLIWRYLQEFGLGQTAARLQRDWGQPNPDVLPFANNIKPHALVILLQKGLRLHEYESSIDQHGNRKSPAPFFGHPTTNPVAIKKPEVEGSTSPARRPGVENLTNGIAHDAALQPPPAKRRRNGGLAALAAGGSTSKARSSDAMEIDHPANGVLHPNEATAAATAAAKREAASTHSSTAAANAGAGAAPFAPSRDTTEMDLDGHPSSKHDPTTTSTHDPDASRLPPNAERPLVNGDSSDRDLPDADPSSSGPSHHQVPAYAALPPPIPTLASGRSVGMQSDKVTDLRPETAVLNLPGKDVTHLHWNPQDPTLLAAGGDALCRIWTLPTSSLAPDPARSGLAASGASPVQPPLTPGSAPTAATPGSIVTNGASTAAATFHAFDLPEVVAEEALVTALAWSQDGNRLAVALHPKNAVARGTILIRSKAGETLDELPGAQDWLLSLAWNPAGTLLLGAAHAGGPGAGSTLMVWDLAGGRAVEPLPVRATVHAACWLADDVFALCGAPRALSALAVRDHAIVVQQEAIAGPAPPPHDWSAIVQDPVTRTIAVAAAAAGALGLLDPHGAFHCVAAHARDLTAVQYQPLANPNALPADAPRLLATASTDGAVKLWDAREPLRLVRTLRLGAEEPALALAFSPDGYLVAAAGVRGVRFWNPETGEPPRASWTADPGFGARPARRNGAVKRNGEVENGDRELGEEKEEDEEEDVSRSLSWDAEGKRVALGAMDQIAIISFRR